MSKSRAGAIYNSSAVIVAPDSCNYGHSLPSLRAGGERSRHQEQLFQSCIPAPAHLVTLGQCSGRNAGWGGMQDVRNAHQLLFVSVGRTGTPQGQTAAPSTHWGETLLLAPGKPKVGCGRGQHSGRITLDSFHAGTGSPACEVFGVCQAGQPWGASSHRAGELPGNLGAGYRRRWGLVEIERNVRDSHGPAVTNKAITHPM